MEKEDINAMAMILTMNGRDVFLKRIACGRSNSAYGISTKMVTGNRRRALAILESSWLVEPSASTSKTEILCLRFVVTVQREPHHDRAFSSNGCRPARSTTRVSRMGAASEISESEISRICAKLATDVSVSNTATWASAPFLACS